MNLKSKQDKNCAHVDNEKVIKYNVKNNKSSPFEEENNSEKVCSDVVQSDTVGGILS